MSIRMSGFGFIVARDGKLIWDDTLEHRQVVIPSTVVKWLSHFVTPIERQSVEAEAEAAAQWLLEKEILVDDGTPRAEKEMELLSEWQGWETVTRLYHFANRTVNTTPVSTFEEDEKRLSLKSQFELPPHRWPEGSFGRERRLPGGVQRRPDAWTDFMQFAQRRRSIRNFRPDQMAVTDLSALLEGCAGISDSRSQSENNELFQTYFRATPSGGGRASTEIYLQVLNVDDLEPGLYQYMPPRNSLVRLSNAGNRQVLANALLGQNWMLDASVLVILVGTMPPLVWKYRSGRAYRDLLLDAGHMSQLIQMSASVLGYGSTLTVAQNDQYWEESLGLTPSQNLVAGILAIGSPADAV